MGRRNSGSIRTPLAEYLARTGIKLADFGRKLAEIEGAEPLSVSLTHWNRGASAPAARWQLAMETASDGQITPRAWAVWKVERSRRPARKRRAA